MAYPQMPPMGSAPAAAGNPGSDPYNSLFGLAHPGAPIMGGPPLPGRVSAPAMPDDGNMDNEHDANLQLADAFHGLGDHEGAAGALAPVLGGGTPAQKTQAQGLLGQLNLQGGDPYNSMMGVPTGASPEDMSNIDPRHAMIIRAMHNAYANKGVNPYDSHPEQKAKWERAWKDKANRDALKQAKLVDKFKSIADRYEKAKKVGTAAVPKAKDQPNYTEGKDYSSNLTSPKSNTAGPNIKFFMDERTKTLHGEHGKVKAAPRIKR